MKPSSPTKPNRVRYAITWASSILLALLVAGCSPALSDGNSDGGGPGHRSQPLGLTPDQELEVGKEAYSKVLSELRGKILPADRPEAKRTKEICFRIVQTTKIRSLLKEINLHLQPYHFEWEVHVVESKEINAFCLPGGKIIVYTAIIAFARSDDELAAVLAHEIAHALAHHSSERVARDQSGGLAMLRNLSYERMQESEADHIGVFLMTFAGYRPESAVAFWEHMQELDRQGRIPEFLSDHPSTATRIRQLRQWAQDAERGKQAFDQGRVVPGD